MNRSSTILRCNNLVFAALLGLCCVSPLVAQTEGDGDLVARVQQLWQSKQWAQALEICRKWTTDQPQNGEACFYLACSLHGVGQLEEAIKMDLKAADYPQFKADALFNLACGYALTGRKDDALAALQSAKDAGYRKGDTARSDPDLESIRDDPRFAFAIVHKFRELPISDRTKLRYAVVLPTGFEEGKTYPVLVAMPPGSQSEEAVDSAMSLFWGRQASQRGWVVVSPAVPAGSWHSRSGTGIAARFLDSIASRFNPEGGKFHLAGCSAGGRSAFRLAVDAPERFQSLSVIPGQPYGQAEFEKLDRLKGIQVSMFVGAEDKTWVKGGTRVKKRLDELGIDCSLTIVPDEGHVIQSMTGHGFMQHMDRIRGGRRTGVDGKK